MGDPGSELERAWPVLLPIQKGCFSENSKDEKARCLSPNANSRFQVGKLVPAPSPRGHEQNSLPKASDQGETTLLGPRPPGLCLEDFSKAQLQGRKGSHVTFFPAVLKTSTIADDTPSSPRLYRGCFQLIMGLYNYGDYSLWLFSSPHLLLSDSLRSLIKHGDPRKVSKVLIRHLLKLKKTHLGLIGTMFPQTVL